MTTTKKSIRSSVATADADATDTQADQPATQERVKLARPHTHGRVRHEAGTEISVPPETATWLRAQGVVESIKE